MKVHVHPRTRAGLKPREPYGPPRCRIHRVRLRKGMPIYYCPKCREENQ